MSVVVAIPVRDEAERVSDCLTALAWQRNVRGQEVLLLLNNCRDDTEGVVRRLAPTLPLRVHVVCRAFPPDQATAGHARREAMQCAERIAGPDGILLTTDADSRVAPDWIANNLAALRGGADLVAGRAIIDPVEALAIPAHLHEDDAQECTYADLLDEIAALLEPDPADPWPRHSEHSGASLAVTVGAYLRAGGIPAVPLGEDRAFVEALRRIDARIRHAPDVTVTVSGRLEGRAVGGMADTMRRRTMAQDATIDDRLEPVRDHARRCRLHRRFRTAWAAAQPGAIEAFGLARALGVGRAELACMLAQPFAGAGWAMAEVESALLRRRTPVLRTDLATQTLVARRLRDQLAAVRSPRAAGRAGIAARVAAAPA